MASKAKSSQKSSVDFSKVAREITEKPLADEIETSFLEYAYLVIEDRALPDARDGLKPVQRRILYSMLSNGLTPDKSVVKSAQTVGHCLGRLHPHGDSSVYMAMVRMAQDFSMGSPLIFPKGNFGDRPGAGPAAARYTEAKLSKTAMHLVKDLKEKAVPFVPTYDSKWEEPEVLPAMFPNLIVNGVSGIAVGVATKMAPHNPGEVIDAARWLLTHPNATLDKLMEFIPGPDFPTGGEIIGLDGIREAYETGRGKILMRSSSHIEALGRGRHAIVFTNFPYEVNSEKVVDQIKVALKAEKLVGVTDIKDLTEGSDIRFTVEVKAGVNPEAIRSSLFTLTSLQETFGFNNIALVNDRPVTLGLKTQLEIWVDFRMETVINRTNHRLEKAEDRLHIVEGLIKALANIDDVIKIIRNAPDAKDAQEKLIKKYKIDETQADYILGLQLRRLTKFDQIELAEEKKELLQKITGFKLIISDDLVLRKVIADELLEVRKDLDAERRSTILGVNVDDHKKAAAEVAESASFEVADEPCFLYLNNKGAIVRSDKERKGAWVGSVTGTTKGNFIAVTSAGRAFRLENIHVGPKLTNIAQIIPEKLAKDEKVLTITPVTLAEGAQGGIALLTQQGTAKITAPQWPTRSDDFSIMSLAGDDRIIAARWVHNVDKFEFAFMSTDSSVLAFPANKVRPQGLSGGGVAGFKLGDKSTVLAAGIIAEDELDTAMVVTVSDKNNGKMSPLSQYPRKGRATGGVRSQALLKGETELIYGYIGANPVILTVDGIEAKLPPVAAKRDASGKPIDDGKLI